MLLDDLDLLALRLRLLHTTGVGYETFDGVSGSWTFHHLTLPTLFFCSLEALLVRRDTFHGVFGLFDRLIDGLIDVLIDPLLRFALGAFGGPVHQTVDIPLSLDLRNV